MITITTEIIRIIQMSLEKRLNELDLNHPDHSTFEIG